MDVGDIDLAWVRTALDEGGLPGDRLQHVEVRPTESGTTSRARIVLTWARDSAADLPASLFVKLPADGVGARAFGTLAGLGRTEVGFYADIRAGLDLPAPRCIAARRGRRGQFALVLDDLAAGGATFPTVADGCDREHAAAVLTALARVHAALWASRRFDGDLRWVFRPAHGGRIRVLQRLMLRAAVRSARRRFSDELGGEHGRLLEAAQTNEGALDAYRATGSVTLLHGDTHLGNTYANPDGTAGLYDWQVLQQGHGVRDLAYFLVLSLPTAQRRAHEQALVRHYVDALAGHGVEEPPSFDDAWFRYRLYALDAFRAGVFTAAMGNRLQPEAQWRAGLERTTAAITDLATADALLEALRVR